MNKLDQAILDINQQEVPETQVEQATDRVRAALFAGIQVLPDRLRGCSDFQAVIPSYLNHTLSAGRSLLLQDHTRECVACRHALQEARSGARPSLIRPATPPTRTISKGWAIAAMALVTVGLGAWVVSNFMPASGGQVAVNSVNGILYALDDRGATAIFAGKALAEGQRVRTAKDSTATVRLPDGSLVEMNGRTELSVVRTNRGATIRLDRGNIIVQAAKQRQGTLSVLTSDCEVAVKGTIFAVDRGTRGSRVTVVEGSVRVDRGSQSQMLKPGEQVSTDASLQRTSAPDAVTWSRDSARYLALLGEFSFIKKGLDAMPSNGLRHDPKLVSYVPDDAVLYASIPNLSTSLAEADRLFRARLQDSAVLRAWWDEQKEGPKLQEMLAKLRNFTEYLGEEIVFTISGDSDGNYTDPLILAEVKRPGLDAFLNAELRQFALKGDKNVPEVVELKARDENENRFYRRDRNRRRGGEQMVFGVKNGFLAVGWSKEQLAELGDRLANPPDHDRGSGLLQNVRGAYERGAGWLLCVNMEHITRTTVHRGRNAAGPKLPRGLEAMRNLMIERKDLGGSTLNQATLTFSGRRSGVADWLAEPSPMGSLDYISPNATFVVSLALRNPQQMISEMFRSMADEDPGFEQKLGEFNNETGIRLGPNLGEPLGGEVTFALDGPLLPLPSWKLIAEVYDVNRMQWGIEQIVQGVNSNSKCADCKVTLAHEQVGNRTFYTMTTDKISYEIHYVFVDGYLIAAPNRSLLNRAIQDRETGNVLSRSERFRSQLPRDGRMNFSAVIYHNLGAVLAPFASQIGSMTGVDPAQRESIQALANSTSAGLIYAYGEPDRVTVATNGSFFGLDLNSLALPSLIGSHMRTAVPSQDRKGVVTKQ